MPRRASLFVFLGFAVALVFVTGISAGAQSGGGIRAKEAGVAAAQDRLMEIRKEVSAAEASYNNALYEMNQLNGQIIRAKDDLDDARKRASSAKENLEERAAQVYKSGNVAFMDVLVGVDNFSEFASRLDLWIRLLEQERADFVELRDARNQLVVRKDRLEAEREQRVDAVERAVTQRGRADKAEARAEAYLDSLNADLRAAIQAAQDRKAEQTQAAMAAMVETATEPKSKPAPKPVPAVEPAPEPIPEIRASEVKRAPVPQPDLQSEQAAADREDAARAAAAKARRLAERRAAERKVAREAAEQAAAEQAAAERQAAQLAAQKEARQEARRQAELAAERAAARRAAREEAERQAELAAERAAIEEAAAEQAAAERAAARRAAERRAERHAEQRAEARQEARAAEASASASAAAAERRAEARREARAAEASASASASASVSSSASASASASATAGASASSSAAPGGGGASAMGDDILAVAQQHLGTPYVLSPPGPCIAYESEDCSCFTLLVFQEFGIALPDSPAAQMGYGIPVSGAPQAGDLLFWSEDGSGYITHVGIAMGDGTTIHASTDLYGAGEVTITDINYVSGYVGARRLL